MKTININAAENRASFLNLIKPGITPDKLVTHIEVHGYFDIACRIKSLLSAVLDLSIENNNADKEMVLFQIHTIVELAIQLLPMDEMDYLDKILEPEA